MLILLDNARDSAQARPLLPGAHGCLALVTSRNQLSGLVAIDGAYPLIVDLLPAADAKELLARRLDPKLMAAEPDALEDIIARCARLPLALSIVAARAATRPGRPLHAIVRDLSNAQNRFDALSTDDPRSNVRAVFSWSYQALSPDAARLFRLLGLHPGPDITEPAAASLAALPLKQAQPMLAELTRSNLLVEHAVRRYSFHDLLRAYATEQANISDNDQQRQAATRRMLDHYLHTAYAADRLLHPTRDPIELTPPEPGTTLEQLSSRKQAMDWLTTEHSALLSLVDVAAGAGFDSHTWQLAWALTTFLHRNGLRKVQAAIHHAAALAAHRLADACAEARARGNLAYAYSQLGRAANAHAQLQQALKLANKTGNPVTQGYVHSIIAYARGRSSQHRQALDHARISIELFQAAGHHCGLANALILAGLAYTQLGDHQLALTTYEKALTLFQKLDDLDGQADTWDGIGYAQHRLGSYQKAVSSYQYALMLYRNLGDRFEEADTLARLGDTHHATSNTDAARVAYQDALLILDQLHHVDAKHIRAKLTTLVSVPAKLRDDRTT